MAKNRKLARLEGVYFVFDIDGTTSFDGLRIEPAICQAFRDLRAGGHIPVLASARPIRDILPMLPVDLKDINCIGSNGALIYEDAQLRVRASLSDTSFSTIKKLISQHQLDYLADSAHCYSYQLPEKHFLLERIDVEKIDQRVPLDEMPNPIKIVLLDIVDDALYQSLLSQLQELDVQVAQYLEPTGRSLDLTAQGVHKLATLAEVLQGHPYVAFGNENNDLQMLAGACYSVAVGTKPEVLAATNENCPATGQAVARTIAKLAQKFAS